MTDTTMPKTNPFVAVYTAIMRPLGDKWGWVAHNSRYTKRVQFFAWNLEHAEKRGAKIRRKQGWRGVSVGRGWTI